MFYHQYRNEQEQTKFTLQYEEGEPNKTFTNCQSNEMHKIITNTYSYGKTFYNS